MLKVGATDVFERKYTQKFRNFAGRFGEFVAYERDRAARDIGLHLTQKLRSGEERMSSALCWFQLKGITKKKLSENQFRQSETRSISLKVRHLQYWYLQPMPTYLVLFVESVDTFLVLNLREYVEKVWGRGIMTLGQKQTNVEVPCGSVLDAHAFESILAKSDVRQWAQALGDEPETVRLCRRDYDLIWHVGTAVKRKVIHRLRIVDWQSKTRGEIHIEESPKDVQDWRMLRNHWQYMLSAHDAEGMYPYLELFTFDDEDSWDDKDPSVPDLPLTNGDVAKGVDCSGEYFEYIVGARLNALGKQMFKSVKTLA
jgi:hypothetical protein